MKLSDLVNILDGLAPPNLAEAWDKVGLLAGDPAAEVCKILLTIDFTSAVAAEARAAGCELVIAYHPPIFQPLKRLLAGQPVFDAIRGGMALYSPHTALDAADGGTNDMLADILGLTGRRPLRAVSAEPAEYKLVTFIPAEEVDRISQALFEAGAGRIGNYSACSFRSAGEGTFFGQAGSNPAVGQAGRLERAAEVRLETVVPIACVGEVIAALRRSHPYEEPAFDLNLLAARPGGRGLGRIGSVESTRPALLARIKQELGVERLLVAGPAEGAVKSAAVCAGSCGNLLHDAIAAKADLFLTGEARHHDALAAAAGGMTVVCALHSNSERPVLLRLKEKLNAQAPGVTVTISWRDRDPFTLV
jgi:dinuclear metal center YbgI/SA1388 family protein